MAFALEARVPLLDHEVVRYALSLPAAFTWQGGETKAPLRAVLHRRVPRALVERPKQGFAIPIESLLERELREWPARYLDPARLAEEGHFLAGGRAGPAAGGPRPRRQQGAALVPALLRALVRPDPPRRTRRLSVLASFLVLLALVAAVYVGYPALVLALAALSPRAPRGAELEARRGAERGARDPGPRRGRDHRGEAAQRPRHRLSARAAARGRDLGRLERRHLRPRPRRCSPGSAARTASASS